MRERGGGRGEAKYASDFDIGRAARRHGPVMDQAEYIRSAQQHTHTTQREETKKKLCIYIREREW